MSWIADLHIHSHFSMATSKECNPLNLHQWAGLKGVSLVGTGDFTHPGWRQELREALIPAEPGFYRLAENQPDQIPGQPQVRFVVSGELSTIYKKNGRTRKVHHLIILPSLEHADLISNRLEELGMNLRSDGRPILGMDSRRLLELVLESCPEVIFIPAHIWTPHFSVFGSNSGFDTIEECYEDLSTAIFALETGLSSDPAMNWRWSALDRFALVSNSDAHNPQNLAREANVFTGTFCYEGLKDALQNKNNGFGGTLEFFPEEGKYHYDGHRNCEVCWKPEETIKYGGVCPVCGRKVTVGVLHRIWELADRPEGYHPCGAKPFQSLVRLREIIGAAVKATAASRKVEKLYFGLLHKLGPELEILQNYPLEDIAAAANPLVAEAVRRLRAGNIAIHPGYDGEYGIISILREDDRQAILGQAALLETDALFSQDILAAQNFALPARKKGVSHLAADFPPQLKPEIVQVPLEKNEPRHFELTTEQQEIIRSGFPVTIVIAGPGTGKTRALVERIAYLIREKGVKPAEITAVTFTNKAAAEIRNRLAGLLGEAAAHQLSVGTFHSLAWRILNQNPEPLQVKLLDQFQAKEIVAEVLRQNRIPLTTREAALAITVYKSQCRTEVETALTPREMELIAGYQNSLASYGRWDFDDILLQTLALWDNNPDWLQPLKQQFRHLLIDEFQDVNPVQYEISRRWAEGNTDLFVIGDPNQAIYGFRGASNIFFENLQSDYPGTAIFRLTRNHRAAFPLVEAANCLVTASYRQQAAPSLHQDMDGALFWCLAPTENAAAKALEHEIVQLLGGATMLSAHATGERHRKLERRQTLSFNDIAVLYRTGRQAESLENALSAAGLPYRVTGQEATLDAAAVKEFLSFFRYLANPTDIFSFRTVLAFPAWGLSKDEIVLLSDIVKNENEYLKPDHPAACFETLAAVPDVRLTEEGRTKLQRLAEVAAYYDGYLERPVAEAVGAWKTRSNPEENVILERLLKLGENHPNVKAFLDFLPLATEADLMRKGHRTYGTEAITLTTIHAAKGLEFPVVFIYGVEEGLLPIGENPKPAVVTEEQRLFYVAVTRAQQDIYFVNVQNRQRSGQLMPTEPSRFLKMLPEPLLPKLAWDRFAEKNKQLELF